MPFLNADVVASEYFDTVVTPKSKVTKNENCTMIFSLSTPLQLAAIAIILPYFLGWYFSSQFIMSDCFSRNLKSLKSQEDVDPPAQRCLVQFPPPTLLEGVYLSLHHNGDVESCGSMKAELSIFEHALQTLGKCDERSLNKFDFESWLTIVFNHVTTCEATDLPDPTAPGFLGFCDRGEKTTPILPDHDKLTRISTTNTLPCHFHTREGVRITSMTEFQRELEIAKKNPFCDLGDTDGACKKNILSLNLYAVPAGRVFMFAPKFVGEIFEIPDVEGDQGAPISLEVLSLSPRIFEIFNFFSREESKNLVEQALNENRESHRVKRSTTGGGKHLHPRRTSESGFDTHSKVAVTVKKRCFKILGFDEYIEGHGDGLQILRYNLTTAYTPHMDFIQDRSARHPHNYDSAGVGGNRFATILMYMSDVEEGAGGETVFTEAWPAGQPENERVPFKDALQNLRDADNVSGILKEGSWEEEMVAKCRSRLAIRPRAGRAILFYSQHPDGREDKSSLHGGCPVLRGDKYAANLWVWNTIRDGFPGAPRNPRIKQASQ